MTLDKDTVSRLDRYATRARRPRATLARELLREALARREAHERAQKLAADYLAGVRDVREVIEHSESAQLDLVGDEES